MCKLFAGPIPKGASPCLWTACQTLIKYRPGLLNLSAEYTALERLATVRGLPELGLCLTVADWVLAWAEPFAGPYRRGERLPAITDRGTARRALMELQFQSGRGITPSPAIFAVWGVAAWAEGAIKNATPAPASAAIGWAAAMAILESGEDPLVFLRALDAISTGA